MNYRRVCEQQEVIEADDPALLVLGAAGTGKTTTAAAAVRAELERRDVSSAVGNDRRPQPLARALFLSFSRASVAQILDRASGVLGPYQPRVEITTFHAFAWRMLRRWGGAVGLKEPTLQSDSEAKLFRVDGTLRYTELLPRAVELCAVPAVRRHLQDRWALIVSDEFQDTDDHQFELLLRIRGHARLLLLGDPNQCIYSTLPGVSGVGPERLAAARALAGVRQIDLPDVSHRDPTNVLPAAAAAIRRREFHHEAVATALASGRLEVRAGLSLADEPDQVAAVVQTLRVEGETVGVFSHHVDATASLSDELLRRDVDHEIVGLTECLGSALDAQHAMVQFAGGATTWEVVEQRLAVFVTSSVRGGKVPELAWMLLGRRSAPTALVLRLDKLRATLSTSTTAGAAEHATAAHSALGLPRAQTNWALAAQILRPLVVSSMRRSAVAAQALEILGQAVAERRVALLTANAGEPPSPVQLMGLYQTKGREADATVVVLRNNDFFGYERQEPFEVGSRLLYVVLTRARHKTVVLIFGEGLPLLIAPLARLASAVTPDA